MAHTTLDFGEVPSDLQLDEPYPMELVGGDLESVAAIINQGIDSYLEVVRATRGPDRGHKAYITIDDSDSMKTFLRRCDESDDDNARDIASGIMSTLGYEWV